MIPERPRVVIAEDEAIVRLDLKEILEEEGYEVVADTGRGDHAVELVDQYQPDLVILDVKMPGIDGLSAAKKITSKQDTAVLILTAFSQREFVAKAAEAGALAYLVKPYQRDDLLPAIQIALTRHREMLAVTAQAKDLEERLEHRKSIDRAKSLLIDELGISEMRAFRFIQQSAMSSRKPMADIAEEIVKGDLRP
tara:strand:+ start:31 stop:615 length:585 start_codon:yes stop_codon:yes gene_type:complete